MPSEKNLDLAQRYTERRRRLMDQMGGGIALIGSPGVSPDPFLLDKNLRYLTGQTSRKAYLLLAPQGCACSDGRRSRVRSWPGRIVKEILFLEERTAGEVHRWGRGRRR